MLTSLPPELLQEILSRSDLPSQLALRQTSRGLNSILLSSEQFWTALTNHKEIDTKQIDQIKILIKEDPDQIIPNSIPVEKRIKRFRQKYTEPPKKKKASWIKIIFMVGLGILIGTVFTLGIFSSKINTPDFGIYLTFSWLCGIGLFLGSYIVYVMIYSSKTCMRRQVDKFKEERKQKYESLHYLTKKTIFNISA